MEQSIQKEKLETSANYDEKGVLKPGYAKKAIKETADKLINALSVKESGCISDFVHPVKGLRFTPYTYVSQEHDVVFNVKEVINFFKDQEHYLWGHYDGTGDKISLTPGEYYDKFIYTQDFVNAEKVGYNKIFSFGNMLENQFEVYLVFEEYENSWKLVGLINNQWTI